MLRGTVIHLLLALIVGGVVASLPAVAQGEAERTNAEQVNAHGLPRAQILIPAGQGAQGSRMGRRIEVEVAATDAARARGLMFRRDLADDAGMLFVWRSPQQVAFWMKNTLIPLDMIFIGADGCVVRIHENAQPGDLTHIPSLAPVIAVLEVKAGMAHRLGLRQGVCLKLPRVQDFVQPTLRGTVRGDR